MLIGDLIARRARLTPHQVFWREGGSAYTYGQLDADACRIARALVADGLRPGDPVGVCAANSYTYATFHFGAAKAGLVLAHLNPRSAPDELVALVGRCKATLLAFGPAQLDLVEAARARLPGVKHWIRLAAETDSVRTPVWAKTLSPWSGAHLPEEPVFGHGAHLREDLPFQMLFTSGTTGEPKGALISHKAKIAQGTTHSLNLGLRGGDRILSSLPLFHQYAQWLVLVCAPLRGAEILAHPSFDAADTWAALEREGVTHLPCVPTTLYRVLDYATAADGASRRAPDLRTIVYGAAPMDPQRIRELRTRFPGTRLFQGFGQTETGYCLGLHDVDHEIRPESLGKPDLFSEVQLLDETGREVAPGTVGEIVARTPYLMNGYDGDPEATAAYFAFGKEWGRTGDLAWRDADGYYHLAGRTKDLIITGGENVYAAEVERVLLAHPSVADAAVVGVQDAEWGEAVHAAIVLRTALTIKVRGPGLSGELEAHCRVHLAGFKCPRRFSFHEEFPRTANGKVKKFELRQAIETQSHRPAEPGGTA